MANQSDLDAALDQLEADIKEASQDVTDGFARLQAKIDAGATPADLTAEVVRLQAAHTALLQVVAASQAEAPAPVVDTPPAV